MFHPQRTAVRRTGFTLVEILVVIAIIAVLVALIAPAVFNVLRVGPQTQTANEIAQLDGAIQYFKSTMGPGYIPSKILLCEKFGTYDKYTNPNNAAYNAASPYNQLAVDSVAYLTQLWPHLLDNSPKSTWQIAGIPWSGILATNRTFILEGDQCLVFFLGGIPVGLAPGDLGLGARSGAAGVYGFATDPQNPADLNQLTGRKGPFFDGFSSDRLIDRGVANLNSPVLKKHGFYSFLDPHGLQPYVYFSACGKRNVGYNGPTPTFVQGYLDPTTLQPVSDCYSLNVSPYLQALKPIQCQCPETHQIISAGADGKFGPGGVVWTKQTAGSVGPIGADDQANFNGGGLLMSGG